MNFLTAKTRLQSIFSGDRLRLAKGVEIPQGTKMGWRRGRLSLGSRLQLQHGVIIDAQRGSIDIGDYVSINDYCVLLGHGGIRIGNDVRIAAHVVIASFDHNFNERDELIRKQGITRKPIVIENDVWIGAGDKVLGGSHISEGCVIGANAVVKGKTVPFGVYVGQPARLIKMRGEG